MATARRGTHRTRVSHVDRAARAARVETQIAGAFDRKAGRMPAYIAELKRQLAEFERRYERRSAEMARLVRAGRPGDTISLPRLGRRMLGPPLTATRIPMRPAR